MPPTATSTIPPEVLGFDYPKICAWREAAKLSREQVSVGVRISCSYLAAIEIGTRAPRLPIIIRLAEFFGHEPGELVIGSGGAR
jgi:transcriptional regulator with XRE-family HTH domain